jgi:two-component system, response regulator PdtaR
MVQAAERRALHASAGTVLVVEDEALIRMMVVEELRDSGFRVVEAANAPEAMALFAADAEIDVVFSDVHMPGAINGLGLAQWVLGQRPGVTVILTSGVIRTADLAAELRNIGPILAKPYETATVVRRIRAAMVRNGRDAPGGACLPLGRGRDRPRRAPAERRLATETVTKETSEPILKRNGLL